MNLKHQRKLKTSTEIQWHRSKSLSLSLESARIGFARHRANNARTNESTCARGRIFSRRFEACLRTRRLQRPWRWIRRWSCSIQTPFNPTEQPQSDFAATIMLCPDRKGALAQMHLTAVSFGRQVGRRHLKHRSLTSRGTLMTVFCRQPCENPLGVCVPTGQEERQPAARIIMRQFPITSNAPTES